MAKISSYRKMRDKKDKEIADLRKQLFKIAANPNSFEAMQIITTWKMKAEIESALMYGDSEIKTGLFVGIMGSITQNNTYESFKNDPPINL